MQKKTGRKTISFILTLAMVFSMLTGIMPGTGLISYAEKYSGEVDGEVELHIGDIIEPNTEIRLCMDPDTFRYPTVVLKAYGYNDNPELSPNPADEDLDTGMKTGLVCDEYGRLFECFPYYDSALADAWIVVSVEDNTITLTGCMEDETLSIVTLNTNGGTINSGNVTTYTEGTEVTLPTDITKEGFIFDGWYDNSNLTGWPFEKIADTETGNKEYWAKWKPAVNSWDSGDCTVTFDNGTLSINKKAGDGDGAMADYTHPDLGGSTVAEWIVDYQENIKSISVGEGVTHIGDYSLFAVDIRDISLPTTLTSIGDKVFYNCFNLESVRISQNVTSIGAGAFEYCINLASVTLVPPKGNSTLTIGQNAFNECNNPSVVYANERGMLYDGETAIEAGTSMRDLEGKTLTWEVQTQTPVPYVCYTGTGTSSSENCDEYTIVTAATNNWSTGWYVVNENVDIDSIITVEGTANLILCDGVSLNATKGINLEEGNTLNIYAQSVGSGSITANGCEYSAGIGGVQYHTGGTLTIHGGTVNAIGGYDGAGIGGGDNGDGGTVNIYNGTVNATGGYEGAGIGGGLAGNGGTVTVYGGTVNAEGGYDAAGIGGGSIRDGGTLTIHGGTVNATGGSDDAAGIGMGFDGDDHGTINLDDGVSLLVSGDNSMWTEYDGTRKKYMKTGATHTHIFSDFTVGTGENSNVITATCVADDRETKCPLKDTGYKASLTITAEGGTYNDEDYNANVTNYIRPLNGYTLSEIKYYKVDTEGSITGGTLLDHAPCDVGYYYASVTISDGNNSYTAAKAFKITKGTPLYTPTVIMDDYSYEGTVSTPSVYDYYGDGTLTYYYNTTDSTTNGTEWKDITNTTLDAGTYYMYAIISDDSSFEDYTTATTSFEVEKASQTAPAAPTIANFTNNSITLTSVEGFEYKRDNEAWQTSPEFTGLNLNTEYTFYQRKAENINHKPSESSDSTSFTLTNVSDGITVDYENETVTAKNGFDISVDGQNIATSAVSLTEMLDGNTAPIIFVRRAQGENNNAGAWGEVTLDSRPDAPTGLTTKEATNSDTADGKINGTTSSMEYSSDNGETWTDASDDATLVKPGTYLVRIKATSTVPAGKAASVEVGNKLKDILANTIEEANNYCENTLGRNDDYNAVELALSEAIATATAILNSTTATDEDLEEAIENLSLAYDAAKFYEHQIYVSKRISNYLIKGDSEACKDLVSSAKTEINKLEYDSDKTLDENFATIENIIEKLKSDLDAQRLAEAKDAAKSELAAYRNSFDDSLYDEDGVSELNKAKTDGDTAIDAAATDEEIAAALKTAKENIDKVYTKDQKAANYVISLIDALPEPVEITWKNIGDYQNDMRFAEQAFNRLTDNQRALINDDRQKKLEGMYFAETVVDTINRLTNTIIWSRNWFKNDLYDEYGIAKLDAIKDKYIDEAKSLQWDGTIESVQEIIDTEAEILVNVRKEFEAVDTISRKNAKAELEAKYDAMKNSGDYDEEGLDELKDAYDTAVAAIDEATVSDTKDDPKENGAWQAEQEGEEALDAVKTKEEKDKEAAAKVLSEISAKTGDDTYYTGKQVELVNKPTTSLPDGYTLEYAVSTSNTEPASGWSTKTPAATEIGSYNVWCRVVEDKKNKVVASKNLTADINVKPSKGTITTDGIYCASNYPSIQAGISIHKSNENDRVEYRWVACDSGKPGEWFEVSPWTKDNNWIDWTPEKSGEYVIVCYARVLGNEEESEIQSSFGTVFHKKIKGICQMPYSGEGGGHLIGIESYDNPDNSYEYEMLILDCNLLIQNKDPWVYTTGRCKTPSNCLWTVWQPQYGYFWTLFRLYDADGNMIDELCYGFANVY